MKRVDEMEVLGVLVESRGSTETALTHNIAKAQQIATESIGTLPKR